MKRGTPTRDPGVLRIDDKTYCVRAAATDPRTGKIKEVTRVIEGTNLHDAVQVRSELMDGIESKALRLESATTRTYADALEKHILPAFGDFYYDALTTQDVQRWIDRAVNQPF